MLDLTGWLPVRPVRGIASPHQPCQVAKEGRIFFTSVLVAGIQKADFEGLSEEITDGIIPCFAWWRVGDSPAWSNQ